MSQPTTVTTFSAIPAPWTDDATAAALESCYLAAQDPRLPAASVRLYAALVTAGGALTMDRLLDGAPCFTLGTARQALIPLRRAGYVVRRYDDTGRPTFQFLLRQDDPA